ncbi:hypothetical protein C5Z26_04075 [Lactobacillus sp. CBA3606]|uniref:hypothetical protein n=1 Tax=Lactobacillus sp. CBA3606 TaxID=2099789 RepID=UPI000CFBDC82|nr:hypothetical protein [Lactobacillus sp. CBA3606]AVK63325.1 hypothetical protein C5Z26_04075 [Lactobacillus sp. CBA3606]
MKKRQQLAVMLLALISLFSGVFCQLSAKADTLPFPDSSVGNYVFGVGSYYNAFAAGKLTIGGSPISTLEGRYAANQIVERDGGIDNNGIEWNKLSQFSPVYVANEIPYDATDSTLKSQGQNMFDILNHAGKLATDDTVVANNLRHQAADVWTSSQKTSYQTLISHLAAANVGDVTYFKDNQASMLADYAQENDGASLTLDADATDATNYFKAAAAQIKRISSYYNSFTTKQATIANGGVTGVTANSDLSGSSPSVTITLADNYKSVFDTEPPMVFLNFSGKPSSVKINIKNMATDTASSASGDDQAYATYRYAPYIFVNWTGVTTSMPFSWGSAYEFSVTDTTGKVITNNQNDTVTNSDGTKATVNQLLSSHILNNFPNATTTGDNYLTADQGDSNNLFTGSIMAPNASIKVSNVGSSQYFYGNVISGKNVLVENNMLPARVMASSFDVAHISSDVIDQLDPNQVRVPKLKTVTAYQGDGTSADTTGKTTAGGGTATDTRTVTATKPLKLKTTVTTNKADYQLFYQLNDSSTWQAAPLASDNYDITQTTNTFELGAVKDLTGFKSALAATDDQVTESSAVDPTAHATQLTKAIYATLAQTNQVKLVVLPKTMTNGDQIEASDVADFLKTNATTYPTTTLKVVTTGQVKATIPNVFKLNEVTDQALIYSGQQTVTLTNDWQVPVSLSLQADADLNQTLADGALPVADNSIMTYQYQIGDTATSKEMSLNDDSTDLLSKTTTPTTSTQLTLAMQVDANRSSANIQRGHTYQVPLRWTLNYDLTTTDD